MRRLALQSSAIIAALLTTAGAARAQSVPRYEIVRMGLWGPDYTGSAGFQYSTQYPLVQLSPDVVLGYAERIIDVDETNYRHAWAYTRTLNAAVPIGLDGPVFTGSTGYQNIQYRMSNASGQCSGESVRITGQTTNLGTATWFYEPATNTTTQTGLQGPDYIGPTGRYYSDAMFLNNQGQVTGIVQVTPTSSSSDLGTDAWVHPHAAAASIRIGLHGPGYLNGVSARTSWVTSQSQSGHVAGYSYSYGVNYEQGRHAWDYDPATQATSRIGLLDPFYTSSRLKHYSMPTLHNDHGVAGITYRYGTATVAIGQNTWFYNPATQTTQLVGLVSPAHTGSAGYQMSYTEAICDNGLLAGISLRITGVNTKSGYNTWMYNPATNTTIPTGLTGSDWTSESGSQTSRHDFVNASGHACGYANKYTPGSGQDTWAYNPITNTNVRTGLFTGPNAGTTGYRFNENVFQNTAGDVFGQAKVFSGTNTHIGWSTWVYHAATGQTTRVGFSGPGFTGSAGYAFTQPKILNDAGWAIGETHQISGLDTSVGIHLWQYNLNTRSFVRLGLTHAQHTSETGSQFSNNAIMHASGIVAGVSVRYAPDSSIIGRSTWMRDPANGLTIQTGLLGDEFTGDTGYRYGFNDFISTGGVVVGRSVRIAGLDQQVSDQAWYFNPATALTIQPTLGIPDTVRTSDGYSYSRPLRLTDDGFLFGQYNTFAGGTGPSVRRVFLFRPDIGFHDLGGLVEGGLDAHGWEALSLIDSSIGLDWIVGSGLVQGQSDADGSRSAFVLRRLPDVALCAADLDDGSGTGTPDGGVTIDDLLYFLVAFEAGTAAADLDDGSGTGTPDGGVTIDDLIFFLVRFEQGC